MNLQNIGIVYITHSHLATEKKFIGHIRIQLTERAKGFGKNKG